MKSLYRPGRFVALSLLFFILSLRAEEIDPNATQAADFGGMEIEQLMTIKVTTPSRTPEPAFGSAAALHVITGEQIRRGGFLSLPEALRLAPGLEVARLDAHQWAISSRGFNDVFANKLLVMMDGRSIYTPLFSGVFWDQYDTLLEDVDRIEVVRGPGGTLWGANAVNGVINIITRSAAATQGLLLMGGGGNEERVFGGFRYGGQISSNVHYRIYAKYANHDEFVLGDGSKANDQWDLLTRGFRLDWQAAGNNTLTFQGDMYDGRQGQTFITPILVPPFTNSATDRVPISGRNILGRWTHGFSEDSELQVQTYYDHTFRNAAIFRERRDTVDVDAQQRMLIGERHGVVFGAGARFTWDEIANSFSIVHEPDNKLLKLFSAFIQDDISIIPDQFNLILGSKLEHNDFTGVEYQPSGRVVWRPTERHTVWGAISRAVRTPSRAEADIRLTQRVLPPNPLNPLPTRIVLAGTESFDSEELLAYEIGYRVELHERVSLDVATFYHHYEDLRSLEGRPSRLVLAPVPHIEAPFVTQNAFRGETYGVEIASIWKLASWWRIQPSYSFLEVSLYRKSGSLDPFTSATEGNDPRHQASLRSWMELPFDLQFDGGLRYVDRLSNLGVPSYMELDLRLAWRPIRALEIALVGHNLLQNAHPEFRPTFIASRPTEVERSVYGKVTWRF